MTEMIEVKTANLAGEALAWGVGTAEGLGVFLAAPEYGNPWRVFVRRQAEATEHVQRFNPHEDWAIGGPLKARHSIGDGPAWNGWTAYPRRSNEPTDWLEGDSPLIAICRAVVAKISGWTVQVPKDLMP